MSATAAGAGGGGKGDKEAEGEGESRGVVDMTEEVAFTPPDGGLRVSKLGLTDSKDAHGAIDQSQLSLDHKYLLKDDNAIC